MTLFNSLILNSLDEDYILLLQLVEGDPHGCPDHMRQAAEGQGLLGPVDHDVHAPVPLVEGGPYELQHAAVVPDQAVDHLAGAVEVVLRWEVVSHRSS